MKSTAAIPHFVFVARAHTPPRRPSLVEAWRQAIERYFPAGSGDKGGVVGHVGPGSEYFTVCEGSLEELDPAVVSNDCIVSPANSFGIMDGGFDLELSRIFQGTSADVYRLTDHVQASLRVRWAGFAPAGSCTLVGLPAGVCGPGRNRWGTHTVGVVPTMKEPEWVGWNRELVYNGMWSLLCEVGRWNAEVEAEAEDGLAAKAKEGGETDGRSGGGGAGRRRISRVVMTGLGTGTGGMDVERCGRQMVLAVKHYLEGLGETSVRWESAEVKRRMEELRATEDEDPRSGI